VPAQTRKMLAALLAVCQLALAAAFLAYKPWTTSVVTLGLATTMARWPHQAGLILVAFVPLAPMLSLMDPKVGWIEAMLAGAVLGGLVRKWLSSDPWSTRAWAAAVLALSGLALASAVALTWAEIQAAMPPAMTATDWFFAFADEFRSHASPIRQALRLSWGAAAALVLAEFARSDPRRERLAGFLVISVAALASLSFYRIAEVALRSGEPIGRLLEIVRGVRISPIIGDPNATGALLLLVTPVALQFALTRGTRFWGVAATSLLLAAAWLAGSRTTLAMTPVAAGATLLLCSRWAQRGRVWGAAAAAGGIAALALLLTPTARNVDASTAWTIRKELGVVTGRMLRDDPVFGVGLGQYYARSREYVTGPLKQFYSQENAHNQFFQIAGELGVPGLAAFAMVLLVAVVPAARWRPRAAAGLLAGVVSFLLISVGQHPLLDPAVGATFWLALGLLVAHVPVAAGHADRRLAWCGLGLALAALVFLPVQASRRLAAIDRSGVVAGASREWDADGSRFYRATTTATHYVPATATHCTLTFRLGGWSGEAQLALRLNHRAAGTVTASSGAWRDVTLTFPHSDDIRAHRRLDVGWAAPRADGATIDTRSVECR
jgi:O-antigen ligase